MKQFLIRAATRNDLVLAALLISIIFMMILPLPAALVDFLIATNLALTVILLMAAVYLKNVTELSAFPSILLLTTLFRLALSITTTRLILLDGHAGHIIATFGKFVVGGNLIVGMVVFLILTIVNFLVITKGSERVAEVSARFSLDSMPGKQMSIDSDMRAGVIDLAEAKHRRERLEQESQLYGAMDGAMKFVKGDAIAGMIIIVVNLAGGISIGMFQRGLPASQALDLYALLTVGDGLIAQIPALFVSITAGFIVTRVSTPDSKDLGSDIAVQLISQPRGLIITAAILMVFAVIPGFPGIIFASLALVVGGGGYLKMRADKQASSRKRSGEISTFGHAVSDSGDHSILSQMDDEGEEPPVSFAITVPIIVDISASVRNSIKPDMLDKEVARARRALYLDIGVPFPGIHLRLNSSLANGEYRIMVNEVPVAAGETRPDQVLVRETEDNLRMYNIPFTHGADFLPNMPSLWVSSQHLPALQKANIQVMQLSNILTYHLTHVLISQAPEFIGVQETMYLLNQMQTNFSDLVKEATRLLPITTITEVLQRLVGEEISIRDMRTILEALVTWGQREKDPIMLTEHIRSALARYIANKYSRGLGIIPAYVISKKIEDMIRAAIRQTSGASYLALSPADHRSLIDSVKKTVITTRSSNVSPVILAPIDIRRFTRKVIERDFPTLAVLSYQELTATVNIQPLARIKLAEEGETSEDETHDRWE